MKNPNCERTLHHVGEYLNNNQIGSQKQLSILKV